MFNVSRVGFLDGLVGRNLFLEGLHRLIHIMLVGIRIDDPTLSQSTTTLVRKSVRAQFFWRLPIWSLLIISTTCFPYHALVHTTYCLCLSLHSFIDKSISWRKTISASNIHLVVLGNSTSAVLFRIPSIYMGPLMSILSKCSLNILVKFAPPSQCLVHAQEEIKKEIYLRIGIIYHRLLTQNHLFVAPLLYIFSTQS